MNNNMIQIIMQAMQNPMNVLQKIGLGPDALRDPQAAVQSLMNSGRMTQQQFNQIQQAARQISGMMGK